MNPSAERTPDICRASARHLVLPVLPLVLVPPVGTTAGEVASPPSSQLTSASGKRTRDLASGSMVNRGQGQTIRSRG